MPLHAGEPEKIAVRNDDGKSKIEVSETPAYLWLED
jgi:hypothetical protein